jgi:thiol-disulfide isomerase/thioredoxin
MLGVLLLALAFVLAPQATAQARPTPPVAELQQSESPSTKLPAVDPQLPAVRIVMFWANGCPHCHAILDQVLPPLQAQYGDQLQVHLIEVSPEATLQRFFQVAAALGIDQNDVFVPFLMIGD